LLTALGVFSQSRRNSQGTALEGTVMSVTARRTDSKTDQIKLENLYLYENGVEQKIKNFSFDPSPAKIVLLIDNSQTLPTDLVKLKAAAMEFAYEIFEGDQLFTIAYDEKPEIIQEWTDDAKKMDAAMGTLRKKGNPYLFDAMNAAMNEILIPLMPGTRKTAVVVIGDGLDRGSKTQFDRLLGDLQNNNITIYGLQIADRTGGAYRRNQPKAGDVMMQLTEGTGGKIFPFAEPQAAAKAICDEMRRNRYLLNYISANTSSYDARKVFLIADDGISVRTKNAQPPNIK
jgi:Ca-activated chloride channel homolog